MSPIVISPPHKIKRSRPYCEENTRGAPFVADAAGRGADGSLEIRSVSLETGDILFGSVIPRVISCVCFLSL